MYLRSVLLFRVRRDAELGSKGIPSDRLWVGSAKSSLKIKLFVTQIRIGFVLRVDSYTTSKG